MSKAKGGSTGFPKKSWTQHWGHTEKNLDRGASLKEHEVLKCLENKTVAEKPRELVLITLKEITMR